MYQGDLIVGKVAMGAGTLNPAGAIALLDTADTAATIAGTTGVGVAEANIHTV